MKREIEERAEVSRSAGLVAAANMCYPCYTTSSGRLSGRLFVVEAEIAILKPSKLFIVVIVRIDINNDPAFIST
jgi:hypothetical protein